MDNKVEDAMRNISPRKFFLVGGNKTVKGIAARWWWLPSFLSRMLVSFVFVQAGLNKVHSLNHSMDFVNFFGNAIFVEHRWDAIFPAAQVVCGALMLLGFFTRFTAALLLGILAASIFDYKLRELTGLNLNALQNFSMVTLLVVLCAAGPGPASIDRFTFKRNSPEAD